MAKIRNINQSAQEREVIKTAPDIVVYLEGLPYLKNPYLTLNASNPFLVNFNDHVTAFNASYDLDQSVPACTISLAVPAHLRYMYQAPGGNNLVKTMMQVQVFMKGYYFANNGDTIYHRIFKGFTSHVLHNDDGKVLQISIQCQGVLGLLGMMQADLSPAIQTSAAAQVTAFKSILASMSPYGQMAYMFLAPTFTDGFYVNSLLQKSIQDTAYFDAIERGFIAKWQVILADLCKETHIYGLQQKDVKDVIDFLNTIAKDSPYKGSKGWSFLAAQETKFTNLKESEQATDIQNVNKIRKYFADMGMGSIQLINQKVVGRLDYVRTLSRLLNYEFYQDIDGQIIIKPPLFNLDVTNLGSDTESDANNQYLNSHPYDDITNKNNPFITHLAEISNETETEDQGAVRATRMIVQGNTSTDQQFVNLPGILRATGEYIDLPKLAQFGLREEPARTIPWLTDQEATTVFAQAAGEMALANRGYRTYSFTMPAKPELKLGFPMFIPHRDMYGYIKSISVQYQIGGNATMQVNLDTLRKRLLFPQADSNDPKNIIFVSQPNLVLKWVDSSKKTTTSAKDPSNSPAAMTGAPMSVPRSPSSPKITADQNALMGFARAQLGSYFATSSDTDTASWQVQPDTEHYWSADNPQSAASFSRSVDASFYADIVNVIPYTDEKGYEVLSPFPWGRWVDLKTALQEFTRDGYVYRPTTTAQDFKLVQGINTFLYAGLDAVGGSGTSDAATALTRALGEVQQSVGVSSNSGNGQPSTNTVGLTDTDGNPITTGSGASKKQLMVQAPDSAYYLTGITEFVLDYSKGTVGGAAGIITVGQPDSTVDSALIADSEIAAQNKVNMFITGDMPQPNPAYTSAIKAVGNQQGSVISPLTP